MKVFAIQKAQVNTGASQFNQNSSQNSVTKTNIIGDRFVSKNVSFGIEVIEMRAELAKLEKQFEKEPLESVQKALKKQINALKDEIEFLTSEGGGSEPARGDTWT